MTIKFETNVPVELTMRYLTGRAVDSQFGGVQHMFSTDQGAFYVSDTVGEILADQFRALGVEVGEPIEICKREVNNGRGRKSIRWNVAKVGFVPGEVAVTPAEASELEKQLKASLDQVQKKAAIRGSRESQPSRVAAAMPTYVSQLVEQTNALVDAYAAALQHAASLGGLVKTEDVRSIFLSAVIGAQKQGGYRAA
jgi:hypothetical protein